MPRGALQPGEGVFSSLGRLILDRVDRGIVLLDTQRRVQDANALGRRLLKGGNGILVRGGRFQFRDPALDERFESLIEAYVAGTSAGLLGIAARVREDSLPPYRVVVTPVPRGDGDTRGVAFFVVVYGPVDGRRISPEVLAQVYGLTPAQAQVAGALFAGLSVERAAAELRLSRNTVRTHLKHIFSRCDVTSQRELLQLLATGPQSL